MNFGIDRMVRWMVTDFMCESDRVFASSVRDRLFQTEPNNGFDLTALNIQRGRDHGLPSYNKYRMFCGLSPALSFDTGYQGLDTHDNVTARALNNIYRHPEDIDLYVGGMTELPMKGALIGPTFGCLIGQQFINYKYGDRFYYENNINPTGFTKNQLNIIKNQTLSAVFCRTSDVSELQRNSFEVPNNKQPRTNCRNLPQLGVQELKEWKE